MRVGDLVRFKNYNYNEHYGVGILTGINHQLHLPRGLRFWAVFRGERIAVRCDELELASESR